MKPEQPRALESLSAVSPSEISPMEIPPTQDRKKIEEVILRAHQALQEEIREKNRLIDELRAERELRDRFFASLAQSLRDPLVAAKAGAELMQNLPDESKLRQRLPVKVAENLAEVDRRLRDFTDAIRIRSGRKIPLALEECNLQEIVLELRNEFAELPPGRLLIRAEQALEGLWCPENLRRALKHLIDQSLTLGHPTTAVSVTARKQGDEAVISVEFQGALPLVETENLSLLLATGITEAHGGTVTIENASERGSIISLRIPLE